MESDSEMETTESSDAIDLRGSSANCSLGGDFLVLVGELTGAKALRCLKLRPCSSSRVAGVSGDPGVDSAVSEDRKNQLGVWDGVAVARGVASRLLNSDVRTPLADSPSLDRPNTGQNGGSRVIIGLGRS